MLLAVFLAGCTTEKVSVVNGAVPTIPSTTTTAPATTTTVAPTTTRAVPKPTVAPRVRLVTEQDWIPFVTAGGVTLRYPSRRVERTGFHESNHEGARQLELLPAVIRPTDLESRGRLTPARTAADVVSDPAVEIRSPVTGKVLRAGTYVLYCKYSDDYVAIEPDDHPGWEVKVLHIDRVRVKPGDRVTAAVTVIAPRPTQLPFASQVDKARSADPAWPHVHLEIIDPSIPNVPSPGSGC